MLHLIQYHKAWEHGNPLASHTPRPYVFTSNQKSKEGLALNAWSHNSRVWLIYRNEKHLTEYYIGYTFKVADIEASGENLELFGKDKETTLFNPPVKLTSSTYPWFKDFMRAHGNFGLGLLPIQSIYEKYFDEILKNEPSILI